MRNHASFLSEVIFIQTSTPVALFGVNFRGFQTPNTLRGIGTRPPNIKSLGPVASAVHCMSVNQDFDSYIKQDEP